MINLDFLYQELEKELKSLFTGKTPDNLYQPMYYPLKAGGKRLRPQLCFMSCQAVGGKPQDIMPAAAALELLHTFTLVHDDIMDHDDIRRGRPTVHKKWDEPTAILAGDGLVTLAYHSLLKTDHPRISDILRLFTKGLLVLCEGQALDKAFENQDHVSLDDYLEMIDKKTGKLIEVSCVIGAMLGNGKESGIKAIQTFAVRLGRAFQIQDDYLDIASDAITTGKPMGSDLFEKKKTFLTIHFLNTAGKNLKSAFMECWDKPALNKKDIECIRELFIKNGTFEETRKHFFDLIQESIDSLRQLKQSTGREALEALAIKVRDRIS